jgi:hypothetical membrane protein
VDVIANSRVPRWVVASAMLAPVGMIGGWTLAASLQPTFDPVRETISALAARSATTPEVMAAGLALTGLAHMVTAAGLRPAPRAGRIVLGVGGLATAVVAMLPVDTRPHAHAVAAAVGFLALSTWPAGGVSPGGIGALRPRRAVAATVGLVGLLVWFGLELQRVTPDAGAATGLAERALVGAQSLWPLVVVLTAIAHQRPPRRP